jgi:hypothetical protein
MKRHLAFEILLSASIVFVPTAFAYQRLAPITSFWNAQSVWSIILGFCWLIVALGYYHQGWLVRTQHSAKDVSRVLPIAVFIVQCILFIKGIYYQDWSLVLGAVLVNSGVVFNLRQIFTVSRLIGGN